MRAHFQHWRLWHPDRGLHARGGATIYAVPTAHGVELYAAVCSLRDVYCRRIGREVARGRMLRGRWPVRVVPGEDRRALHTAVLRYVHELLGPGADRLGLGVVLTARRRGNKEGVSDEAASGRSDPGP